MMKVRVKRLYVELECDSEADLYYNMKINITRGQKTNHTLSAINNQKIIVAQIRIITLMSHSRKDILIFESHM